MLFQDYINIRDISELATRCSIKIHFAKQRKKDIQGMKLYEKKKNIKL
mgnify:CR=1 FL=1